MKRILIVDDESDICDILKYNLDKAGFQSSVAHSAEEAVLAGLSGYDLVLLDVMMEGLSGFRLAEIMKKNPETSHIPIIFVTALDNEDDTVKGLGLGADDYISKPFSVREVVSRVQAVLRRTSDSRNRDNCLTYKTLVLDDDRKSASVDGASVDLTRIEYGILHLLLSNPSHVYSREEILSDVWPNEVIVLGRTVDVNITRLRKKLGVYGQCIVTRHGYGYCFDESAL